MSRIIFLLWRLQSLKFEVPQLSCLYIIVETSFQGHLVFINAFTIVSGVGLVLKTCRPEVTLAIDEIEVVMMRMMLNYPLLEYVPLKKWYGCAQEIFYVWTGSVWTDYFHFLRDNLNSPWSLSLLMWRYVVHTPDLILWLLLWPQIINTYKYVTLYFPNEIQWDAL